MVRRIAGLLLIASNLGLPQTRTDLKTQSKNVDFSTATLVRPFRTGTALPATCLAGEMFFKTDAAPGVNVYGCVAANTWEAQTSGSALNAPLPTSRTSATTLSVGPNCSVSLPCRVRYGSVVTNLTAGATVTATSGSGTAYIYVNPAGAITVGVAAAGSPGVICSGCAVATGVTGFPADSLPLAFWAATSGTWDAAGTDSRATLSAGKTLVAGPNIALAETGASVTISATIPSSAPPPDPGPGPAPGGFGTELQFRNEGLFGAVTNSSVSGGAVRLGATAPVSPAESLLGLMNAIVGGSANGTALGINAPASFLGDLANLQNNGTPVFRIDSFGGVTFGGGLGSMNGNTLQLVSPGGAGAVWLNYSTSANSTGRLAIQGTAATNQLALGTGAASNFFVANGLNKIAMGTAAPAPGNTATAADLLIQDATPSTGNTQVVVQAGGGQNRDLTQWMSAGGVPGARVSAQGALRNLPFGAKPSCDSSVRGMLWHTQGATNVKDDVQVCAKDSANVYAWRALF